MFLTTVLLASLAASPSPSPSPISDAVRKTLTDDYALECTATLDPSDPHLTQLFATLDPAFVNIDTKGVQIKHDSFVASVKAQLKVFHGTDCSNSFESITAPDDATVVIVNDSKISGKLSAPDGSHDLDFSGRSEDTWKLQGGVWLETQSKDLQVLVKVDGNTVTASGI
jgi:hypothetical protein